MVEGIRRVKLNKTAKTYGEEVPIGGMKLEIERKIVKS